jgi:hypothetical protein
MHQQNGTDVRLALRSERRSAPRVPRLVTAAVGLTLLVGAPLTWSATQPAESVGELPPPISAPATASTDADGAVPDAAPDADEPAATPSGSAGSISAGEVKGALAPRPAPPINLRIDRIGVDHPLVPVGLEPDGTMEIPEDVQEVGWYDPGVRPGENGSAVLSGHVDSRTQGRGAFFELGRLDVDDLIVVTTRDGSEQQWRVVARTRYPKDELPVEELFVWGGDEPRLVLITCGGDFDRSTRHYTDNVVVHAVPA